MPTPRSPEVTVDTESIPEHSRLELLSIIYDATAAYFQQPGVVEKFEQWREEKRQKKLADKTRKGVD